MVVDVRFDDEADKKEQEQAPKAFSSSVNSIIDIKHGLYNPCLHLFNIHTPIVTKKLSPHQNWSNKGHKDNSIMD